MQKISYKRILSGALALVISFVLILSLLPYQASASEIYSPTGFCPAKIGAKEGFTSNNSPAARFETAYALYKAGLLKNGSSSGYTAPSDISGKWYKDAAEAALKCGVMQTVYGYFSGGSSVTRADFAVMLQTLVHRLLGSGTLEKKSTMTKVKFSQYTDVKASASYAEAVSEMSSYGFMIGLDQSTRTISAKGKIFAPSSSLSLGELYESVKNVYIYFEYDMTVLDSISHDWGSWHYNYDDTDVYAGTESRTCSSCDCAPNTRIRSGSEGTTVHFPDVSGRRFYYSACGWAATEGITKGTSETEFSPEAKCTRAQIVTFLYRYYGTPEPKDGGEPFDDVSPDDYFYKAVLWASQKGITTGTSDTTFSPDDICTRAQIVSFIYRAKIGGTKIIEGTCPFTDVKKSDYFYYPVLWANKSGIAKGFSDTVFKPNGQCTRGEAVTFLFRLYNLDNDTV